MQRVIDTENERTRNMFVGEKGATEADKAEEVSTRLDNLSVARRMEEAEKNAKTIKMATGWERGSDGKWRYETGDAKIKDTIELDGKTFKRYDEDMLWTSGKFGDVVDAPELFKAYPELKDVRIETDAVLSDMPSNGEYNPRTNTITIHSDDLKYQNSILNHEIQHAIQHIEGFASGGNFSTPQLKDSKEYKDWQKMLDDARKPSFKEEDIQATINSLFKDYNDLDKKIKEFLSAEETRMDGTGKSLLKSRQNRLEEIGREITELVDELEREGKKRGYVVKAVLDSEQSVLFNLYNRLAGEVEARNTEKRIGMTEEERRASLASETEDVAREDQILLGVDNADGEMNTGSVREHRVYHGSGADFDAFDHSHMGEGEGAQAYGWGTYVTEVEGIGRTYAIQNTTKHNDALRALQHDVDAISDQLNRHRDDLKYVEEQLKRANEWRAEAELDYELFRDEAEELKEKYGEASPEYRNHLFNDIYTDEMKRAQSSVKSTEESIQYRKEKIAELEKALKDKQAEIDELPKEFPRHLYTVEIPDDNGSNYLDWNGHPAESLLKGVGSFLESNGFERVQDNPARYEKGESTVVLNPNATGADLYAELREALGSDKKASQALAELGCIGIKYPADNMRGGRKDGAKNYVIFNENDAKITDHTRFLRTADGEVYGLVKDGRIYLDPKVATSETAVHEYTHLWGDMLRRKDSEQWSHTVKELKNSVLWEEVKELYPELKTDDEIADEVLSTFSGRRGAERLREEARRVADGEGGVFTKAKAIETLERVKEAIARFWEGVARMFGINRYRSAEELADMAMKDLLDSKNPMKDESGMRKRGEVGETLATSGTYFSGGGLLEAGLKGVIDPKVAVEFSEKIAGVYADNHGNHIVVADVRDVDPKKLVGAVDGGEVQYFHASPVCKNFSKAKREGGEVELDKETALSTAEFIAKTRPKVVTIENVKGYRNSEALKIITDELTRQGYDWDADVYNAADYGGYTKRERLIVRAKRDGKLPPKPEKLPEELRKKGWYSAVEDLIPHLEEKKTGVPQGTDERLKNSGIDYRTIDKPLYVFGRGYANKTVGHAFADELLPTLTTGGGDIIIMPDGRVLKASPRVLARVTGLPDTYKMPETDQLSHTIVGNGIPTQLTEGVIAPLLDNAIPSAERATKRESVFDVADRVSQNLEERTRAMAERIAEQPVEEINNRFNEELEKYQNNELPKGHRFELGMPSAELQSAGFPTLPISMRSSLLAKKAGAERHPFAPTDLRDLVNAIQKPIAIFNYSKNNMRNLIVDVSRGGKHFLVGVTLNYKADNIEINSVSGLFPKENHEWIKWIQDGKVLRIDQKEKVQDLINSLRTNPAESERIGLNLDDVAKKVKDFENPKLFDGKISEVDKKGSDSTDRSVRENPKNEDKPRFSRKPGESIFDYASRVSEDVDRSVRERVSARDEYEKKVKSKGFQTKEALQNSMLGLQEFMSAIDHASGNKRYIEDIPDFENPILGENRLSSVNKEEMHQVAKTQFKPLMSAVAKLSGNGKESGELYDYMFAKHGLERDAVMRQREAQKEFDKYQKANPKGTKTIGDFVASLEGKDYAGLTALTAEDGRVKSIQSQIDAIDEQMKATDDQLLLRKLGGQKKRLKVDLLNAARDAADDIRKAFESNPSHDRSDINELWSRVNEVNGNTLRKLYESGMLTKEAYNDISSMYTNYIPMRGFDQTTSADAYAYLTHGDSAFNAPIKTAKGRSSKADNPIAYMQAMAESAIMQGNRNVLVKQKMLNFVRNHPSDLASVSDVWLQYDSVADEWKPVFPDNIDANDSASVVAKKMEAFEDKMKQMAEKHPDLVQRSNEAPDIPYKVVEKGQLNEHQVLVKQNGKSYIITVNGSPRAAQAANGLTNPDTDLTGAVGKVFEGAEALNRQLSSLYTTLNPDFIGSNYVRDALYSNTMVYVKEGAKYGGSFNLNFAKYNPAEMANLYARYNKGSLDTSNETHRLFLEFMQNGGETGFVNLKQIEKRKSEIAKAIKRDGEISAAQIWGGLNDAVDFANRAVENSARFAAYVTSRKSGRSVGRSVYDAKEISVNFNRKGSGRNWWKDNVGTSRFYDTEIGLVEINRASVGSSLAHRYSQVKLDVITSLAEGFNNAVYFGSMQDFSRQEGVKSHYFAYPINYNGNRNYVFCRAMQDANKSRLYVHEVFFSG
uniref:DNA cytosine methyltransferase n=1 Tax=Candidatus Limisoma sp. TaxID=3076476 RepID=UPI0040262E1D